MPDLNSLTTPEKCVADFCLIPVTPPEPPGGVRPANQGYRPTLADRHAHGISVAPDRRCAATDAAKWAEIPDAFCRHHEGSWDDVMRLIGQAHVMLHESGVLRIQTDIRIGSRIDKEQSFADKVSKVEELLARDSSS
ncbi:hypothetical protein MMC07_007953 [Pseudocyphellaria aurata]|nr:hypothetical protein [Pseudocyphellaria aurata]